MFAVCPAVEQDKPWQLPKGSQGRLTRMLNGLFPDMKQAKQMGTWPNGQTTSVAQRAFKVEWDEVGGLCRGRDAVQQNGQQDAHGSRGQRCVHG